MAFYPSQPGSKEGSFVPSPWLDYASLSMPDSHQLILWWSQYIWNLDGTYRTAMERVASHFITSVQFPDLEPDEENSWKDLFLHGMDYKTELLQIAREFLCYGNAIIGLYLPFKRFAICKNCGTEQPLSAIDYRLEFSARAPNLIWHRKESCPKCGNTSPYEIKDRRDSDLTRVAYNRFNPMDIEIAQNKHSLRKDIYWKISEEDRKDYNSKARIHIDDTPLEVLEAVAVNGKLKLNPDLVLHISEQPITGIYSRGWGLPRAISNFRTGWLLQLTNKADQACVLDYTLGMRVISPAPTAGGTDPMQVQGNQQFVDNIQAIIGAQRKNPTSYHTAPFPLNYQFMGGEGATLITPDKLKFRQQEYLNQLGVPLEYHQGTLSAQAAPMALRLFESYWNHIPAMYNKVLDWTVKTLARVYGLEETAVLMQKTTVVDDMNYKSMLMQLMAGNQLSPQTAFEPLGIDAYSEAKKVIKQQEFIAKLQQQAAEKQKQEEEMGVLSGMVASQTPSALQQGAQGAAPGTPQGGMPMGGIPGVGQETPTSLAEMDEQATQIAQQILPMQDFERKSQLKQLREGNKQLHSLVKAKLEELRSQARSQGGQMMIQQSAGQAPPQ
jgi:hypothetical protein